MLRAAVRSGGLRVCRDQAQSSQRDRDALRRRNQRLAMRARCAWAELAVAGDERVVCRDIFRMARGGQLA